MKEQRSACAAAERYLVAYLSARIYAPAISWLVEQWLLACGKSRDGGWGRACGRRALAGEERIACGRKKK
jgi:hypothetical protein